MKNKTSVTLIVLVVSLVILASISINTLMKKNGILQQTQTASIELPDNEVDTKVGTIVKTPIEWLTETQVASIYAVAIGDGISVPVPYGFYYVGGNLESGVVISDNEIDKNKYVGQSDVPSGLEIDETGNPIYTIQGNQFVWIPCTPEEYHKTAFDTKFQNSNWDTTVGSAELTQIQKYGGFYVGRFEAGLATDIPEFTTTQKNTGSNQVYNKEGVPQLKPGKIAWSFVDWKHSKTNSETMYNTKYVNSGLITGTQWDVMLQRITSSDPTKSITSSNWGNYYNQELTYTGRSAKAYINESTWYQEKAGDYVKNTTKTANSSSNPCYILSTGASEQAKSYNLYDVAGNLWEWTEEASTYQTGNHYRVLRGGRLQSQPINLLCLLPLWQHCNFEYDFLYWFPPRTLYEIKGELKMKNKTSVTLIVLVVSLVILASISINALMKKNGILQQTQTASIELPDNEVDTKVGTIVKTPIEWLTETQVASIYAVAIGDGISVPVPYGFYYVGGNLQSGVVISDNEIDKNKYVGQSDVPSGLEIDETGNPIYTIQGNQFVWIPCTPEEYYKTAFDTKFQNSNWDTTVGSAELTQIQKYGGFYVGRFEAGLASEIEEFTTTQTHTGSNQVYNKEGIPQLKPGKVAWNFVDWNYSKTNSETMYNTKYVNSGLITGTQWDVMLNKITTSDSSKSLTSSNWGNYYDQQLIYTGRNAKAYANGNTWYQEKSGGYVKNATKVATSTNNPCYILSTGASEQAKAYNLYDVAGNLWEWTEENSTYVITDQYRILRGGSYSRTLSSTPACYRNGIIITYTDFIIGFRPVLYMK